MSSVCSQRIALLTLTVCSLLQVVSIATIWKCLHNETMDRARASGRQSFPKDAIVGAFVWASEILRICEAICTVDVNDDDQLR